MGRWRGETVLEELELTGHAVPEVQQELWAGRAG